MRKVLCTLATGPQRELLELALPSFERYAEQHGYELDARTEQLVPDRPPAWSKLALVRERLHDADLVLWLDADAIVVDPSADIASELTEGSFFAIVQHRFWGNLSPNTGVFLLRSGALADSFLDAVWNDVRYLHHPWWENAAVVDALGYSTPPWGGRLNLRWRAQNLVRDHLGRHIFTVQPRRPSRFREATTFLDVAWNSTPMESAERPRIKHYAGLPLAERAAGMRQDAEALGPPAS